MREALGLALDYEWMNRQMFYGAYQRVNGLFGNTACETRGTPSPEELALMEPFRNSIPTAAFGPMTVPPRTDGDASLRANLRRAQQLLKEAGWEVRDGALRNAKGQAMVLEYMDSNEGGVRTITPWMRSLEKLGITLRFRSVDFALYQQRLQKFDFDITSLAYQGTHNPGQEFADLFGSTAAADTEDSGNFAGVKNPAVDALDHRHDLGQDRGATAARLPCAGARDCAQPLPGAPVGGCHPPHGLQRLAPGAGPDGRHAAAIVQWRGLGDRHLVGAHTPSNPTP